MRFFRIVANRFQAFARGREGRADSRWQVAESVRVQRWATFHAEDRERKYTGA